MAASQGSYRQSHEKRMRKENNEDKKEILGENLGGYRCQDRSDIDGRTFERMACIASNQNAIQMSCHNK